ncbi:MAG: hypothetical protein ACOZQL_02530 [Myxococcota bacterium]
MRRTRAVFLLMLAVLGCSAQSNAPELSVSPGGTRADPLFALDPASYTPWTLNGNVVPVCWETTGYDFQKEVMEDAIAREWGKKIGVEFQWTALCPTSGAAKHVRLNIAAAGPTEEGQTLPFYGYPGIGMRAFHTAADGTSVQFWLKATGGNTVRWEYLAVHEMGHVLGYQHEMDRPDNTANQCSTMGSGWVGGTFGDFDMNSIMSYCNGLLPFLSETDVTGGISLFGPPKGGRETQFLVADFTNDNKADVVQAYRRWSSLPTCVTGTSGFNCSNPSATIHDESTPQQRFLVGNFNGDGYKDVAQVYRGWSSIPVCLGGSGPSWTCSNLSASFVNSGNSEQEFLAADYDGDGDTDVIQTARGQASMPVCTYGSSSWSCSNYSATGYDSGDPGQRFLVAKFNADARADVIQVDRNWTAIPVCTSTTSGWSCNNLSAQIHNSGSNEQQFLTGDFDNDGLTDVFQTWRKWQSIPVCKSTGTAWSCSNPSATIWNANHPEQRFLTGDFNGDGKTDIAQTFRGWDSIPVCLSTGTSWNCSNWPALVRNSSSPEQKFIAADFDNDGKTDIIQAYRGWRSYVVCLSTGSGWNCSSRPATIYNWD